GRLADRAREEFGALDERQTDLVEPVTLQDLGGAALDARQLTRDRGQSVAESSDRRNRHRRARYHALGERQFTRPPRCDGRYQASCRWRSWAYCVRSYCKGVMVMKPARSAMRSVSGPSSAARPPASPSQK